MKKCFALMWTMLLVGLLGLCAGCKDSPKAVVEKWQKTVVKGDVSEATKYCTSHGAKETLQMIDFLKSPKAKQGDVSDFKTSVPTNEQINGNEATVTLGKFHIRLKMDDGKWKVDNL